MSQLFARKPIEDLQPPGGDEPSLERVLGAGDLIMLAIGAVIGAGIFGAIGLTIAPFCGHALGELILAGDRVAEIEPFVPRLSGG